MAANMTIMKSSSLKKIWACVAELCSSLAFDKPIPGSDARAKLIRKTFADIVKGDEEALRSVIAKHPFAKRDHRHAKPHILGCHVQLSGHRGQSGVD